MNSIQFNNNLCGQTITISYGGKSTQASVQDECPGCPDQGLDLSEGLFSFFAVSFVPRSMDGWDGWMEGSID